MKLCKVREYSLPLFAGILIAMIMVNVNSDFYYEVIYKPLIAGTNMTLHFFVNECFMDFLKASPTFSRSITPKLFKK